MMTKETQDKHNISQKLRNFWNNNNIKLFSKNFDGNKKQGGFFARPASVIMRYALVGAILTASLTGYGATANAQNALPINSGNTPILSGTIDTKTTDAVIALKLAKKLPKTEYSTYLNNLQEGVGRYLAYNHIIFLDRDLLTLSLGMRSDAANKTARWQQIDAAITDQTKGGVKLSSARLQKLDNYLTHVQTGTLRNLDNQMYYRPYSPHAQARKVCIVVPSNPNTSVIYDLAKFSGIKPSYFETLGPYVGEWAVSKDLWRRYEDYQRASKCYDDKYYKKAKYARDTMTYVMARHKSEVFADVHAALMMARDGVPEAARLRADMRFLATLSKGNNASAYGSDGWEYPKYVASINYTGPAMRATEAAIGENGIGKLRSMSRREIIKLAQDITKNNALKYDEIITLTAYLNGKERSLTNPELVGSNKANKHINFINNYKDEMRTTSKFVFGKLVDINKARFIPSKITTPYVHKEDIINPSKTSTAAMAKSLAEFKDQLRSSTYMQTGIDRTNERILERLDRRLAKDMPIDKALKLAWEELEPKDIKNIKAKTIPIPTAKPKNIK